MFGRKTVISIARGSVRSFAAPAEKSSGATSLVLNLVTPHATIYNKKVIDKVILPGEGGEYGVTMNHSPLISQLKPGVVTIIHTTGTEEKFFVPGGFALTNADSVTDVSVTEAIPLAELDSSAIKSGYSAAVNAAGSAAEGSVAKAAALVEVGVYSALARAAGVTL